MNFLLKYRLEILLCVLLIVGYFALRLPNLTLQPIFADEAIYIRWAQVMKAEPTLRFLPLSDGKTPLFMWILMPLFKVFQDPLFAGRFLSVVSGFFTLIGVFWLAKYIFGKKAAFFASLLVVISPYMVFFDRMALVDSMLAAFTVWSILAALYLLRYPRFDLAMILGYLLGGALLVKTPAMVNFLALPFTIIALPIKAINQSKRKLMRLFACWTIAFIVAMTIYNLLRLGPGFYQLSARNADYIFTPAELAGRPLDPFIPHLKDIFNIFPIMLTWPVLIAILLGIISIFISRNKLGMVLLIWLLIPLLLQMAFLKTFTARYLLLSIPPLLIIGGFGLTWLLQRVKLSNFWTSFLVVLLLPLALRTDTLLLTDPQNAPLPRNERAGYFEEWTAGYGFEEIAKFFTAKHKEKNIVIGTEGYFGTLPDGLQIYLDKSGISIVTGKDIIEQLKDIAKEHPTYYVANGSRTPNNIPPSLKMIIEYPKAPSPDGKQNAIQVYEVYPEEKL